VRRFAAWLWIALAVASSAGAQLPEPRIVNGLPTNDFPTTGALLQGSDPNTADSLCSGTLIGCNTFLTAAHCVCETSGALCQPPNAPNPNDYKVFLQHAGLFSVSSISVRSDFVFPVGDVAIVKLAAPVAGVAPSQINETQAPAFGTDGTIAGFGRSSGTVFDYGLKRYGAITTGACPLFVSPTTSVCWTFEAPVGPPGTDSNTCNADSGGPLFVDFGAGPVVAGVTSGGTGANCLATDQSYDANVYTYRNWITSVGGADLDNASCGALPQVGSAGVQVNGVQGTVSSTNPEGRSTFTVPAETALLRVAMNAHDDGIANFDLYLKQGAAPTTTSFDCARTGTGQFGFCEFSSPAAGTWHVLVQRMTGAGSYQVTASAFEHGLLSVDLSTGVPEVAPGGLLPLTISLANQTGAPQPFVWFVSLIHPDGTEIPLIPVSGGSLPSGGSFAPLLSLPLPATAPVGNWGVGALLWQQGVGVVDQAFVSFEVR
jgi:hypothetical protein